MKSAVQQMQVTKFDVSMFDRLDNFRFSNNHIPDDVGLKSMAFYFVFVFCFPFICTIF